MAETVISQAFYSGATMKLSEAGSRLEELFESKMVPLSSVMWIPVPAGKMEFPYGEIVDIDHETAFQVRTNLENKFGPNQRLVDAFTALVSQKPKMSLQSLSAVEKAVGIIEANKFNVRKMIPFLLLLFIDDASPDHLQRPEDIIHLPGIIMTRIDNYQNALRSKKLLPFEADLLKWTIAKEAKEVIKANQRLKLSDED